MMITLLESGWYKLTETKGGTKMLFLDDHAYAWVYAKGIGEMLVASYREFSDDAVLSLGQFKLYDVEDEEEYSDHLHLELEVANGSWQGYLLLTGLPDGRKKRARIVPTTELISREPMLSTSALPSSP